GPPSDGSGMVDYLIEPGDPCQAPDRHYVIDGVPVSDFALPQFYDSSTPAGSRCSYQGHLNRPFSVDVGGYVSWRQPGTKAWWQWAVDDDGNPTLRSIGGQPSVSMSLRAFIDGDTTSGHWSRTGLARDSPILAHWAALEAADLRHRRAHASALLAGEGSSGRRPPGRRRPPRTDKGR